MNLIRRAALNGGMSAIPADLRAWAEQQPEMDPPFRDYRSWRRPRLDGPALFWREVPDMEEELTRFPAGVNADEYVRESENKNWPEDSDVDMEDSEWYQFTGGADEEQSYD